MRTLWKFLLLLTISASPALANNCNQAWPTTQNPVSAQQNTLGQCPYTWINGSATGVAWKDVQVVGGFPGVAHGTSVNHLTGHDDDSTAVLSGTWGWSQQATATISVTGTDASTEREVELRLNTTITANNASGYEFTIGVQPGTNNGYLDIVRWNGGIDNFCYINSGATCNTAAPLHLTINNGDIATAVNSQGQLTLYINGVPKMTAVDTTFQGGSPGVGFWNIGGTTGNLLNYGFSSFYATDAPWLGQLTPFRAMDWSLSGVLGGIPTTRTQCGSTLTAAVYGGTSGAHASPAPIAAFIAACPAGTYALLGPGTFYLTSGINISSPTINVTLRGSGANQTNLILDAADSCNGFGGGICVQSSDLNYGLGPENVTAWTAGYSQYATIITLTTVTNLKVGNPIILDQLDDSCASPTSNDTLYVAANNTTITPACALEGQAGGLRSGRAQAQVVQVIQCDGITTPGHTCSSGSNISITPGLYMSNWSGSRTPQAWWANNPIFGIGIEDLSIDNTATNADGIFIQNCLNCWVKGVTSIKANYAHFIATLSDHVSVVNNYLFISQGTGAESYGVVNYGASDMLSENNIVQGVPLPQNMTGAGPGSVFGYNFNILNFYGTVGGTAGYLLGSIWDHTSGTELVLFDGNHGPGIEMDLIHGTHNLDTIYRNYLPGQGTCMTGPQSGGNLTVAPVWNPLNVTLGACITGNLSPIELDAFGGRIFNVLGNILGTTGFHASYQNDVSSTSTSPAIYSTGFGNNANGITTPNDTSIAPLLLKFGNCDAFTGFSAANCRFNSGEVPSGLTGDQALYANPVPAVHTLPASYYYNSKPSWWPSTKAWPPIGPDVTSGNESGTGGLANSIPAEDCYLALGGATNGYNATALSFNENSCYFGVAPPTFNPVAGTYTALQLAGGVILSTVTPGATICYTTDSTVPQTNGAGVCTHGSTYSTAIPVSVTTTILAIGTISGSQDSSVASAVFVVQASPAGFAGPKGGLVMSKGTTFRN